MQFQVPKTTMWYVAVNFYCVVTFKCAVMDTFIKHLSLDILYPAVLQRNRNMQQRSQNGPGRPDGDHKLTRLRRESGTDMQQSSLGNLCLPSFPLISLLSTL